MALGLVRCSIEADQGGTLYARARVSLVSWEGRSHALLVMAPLGLPCARPMAQALRLPFEYYYYTSLCEGRINSVISYLAFITHMRYAIVFTHGTQTHLPFLCTIVIDLYVSASLIKT